MNFIHLFKIIRELKLSELDISVNYAIQKHMHVVKGYQLKHKRDG